MKLILLWLLNTIIALPLKIIVFIIKLIYNIINNIYFNHIDIEYINNMNGYEFEILTKILLQKNGFKNVKVSKLSNDYGIDVLATKHHYTYAIQCKRYNKAVGIKAIQEAKSGCDYYNYDIPVVFTNTTFTSSAIKLAKSNEVELWDNQVLYRYLKKSKILTKSLPFYYPIISIVMTTILGYLIKDNYYLIIPFLISLFILFSIIIKIITDKKKTLFIKTESNYQIHDYSDSN